ncbi:hypothetical protein AAEO56_18620 [Flavobacterium sp. DGU11]|uniref:DUF4468 domain-containing protein n=1 Tax=Flavobacterium arundinis TaxID=3139143 RepID=A0ABU9I294_9FLAO
MKVAYLIFMLGLLTPSTSVKDEDFINKRFTYIDPFNEWDLELLFFSDSTFTLQDKYGCRLTSQKGHWRVYKQNSNIKKLILTDTVQTWTLTDGGAISIYYKSDIDNKTYSIRKEFYFPLIENDTIEIYNDSIVKLRKLSFDDFDGDIEEKRVLMLESYLIKTLGKDQYLKKYGKGSIEDARKTLKICR